MNNDEFLVSDEEFEYTFNTVFQDLKKELIKARLSALVETEEVEEVEEV